MSKITIDDLQKKIKEKNFDKGYYTILPEFLNMLGLKPRTMKREIFAIIYSFNVNQQTYTGSVSYLMKALQASKPTILRNLDELIKGNLLIKIKGDYTTASIYSINVDYINIILDQYQNITSNKMILVSKQDYPSNKMTLDQYQNVTSPSNKMLPNNTIYNTNNISSNNTINFYLLEQAKDLIEFYTNNISVDTSHSAIQILCNCVELYKKSDIFEAMKKTMEKPNLKDVAFMKYTRGILQNWQAYGKETKTSVPPKNKAIDSLSKLIQGGENTHGTNSKQVDNFNTKPIDWSKFD